jgi:UDP-N-acetylglucosamine 2-epimerase (non-hydrolysing)
MPTPFRIVCIAGARPNFMKIAPLVRALDRAAGFAAQVVHTGQHYDASMSRVFFEQLGIPEPAVNLGVGSARHGVQTGRIMERFDQVFEDLAADLVVVVGDVNSTIACALVARKLDVPVAHVEAGLRSFDRSMPEEINRVLTDQISDLLFTTEEAALDNLLAEGIPRERVHFVGNTMIDTLVHMWPRIEPLHPAQNLGIDGVYGVVTFHRPSNVDRPETLKELVDMLLRESERVPLVFPVHPRTRARLEEIDSWDVLNGAPGLYLTASLSYIEFLALVRRSRFVLTDSGGIQEETTWLNVPCLTQRTSTERPITTRIGTNTLLGTDFASTHEHITRILEGRYARGERPDLWDGRCAERIVAILGDFLAAGDRPE